MVLYQMILTTGFILSLILFITRQYRREISIIHNLVSAIYLSVSITIIASFLSVYLYGYSLSLEVASANVNYLLTVLILLMVISLIKRLILFMPEYKHSIKRKLPFKSKLFIFFFNFIIFLSLIIYTSAIWVGEKFGDVSIEQLLYSIRSLEGTDTQMVFNYLDTILIPICFFTLCTSIVTYSLEIFLSKFIKPKRLLYYMQALSPLLLLIIATTGAVRAFGVEKITNYFATSTFIEDNYVDSRQVNISFPEQKRNLIYIFVESLEGTYTSIENGGIEDTNLIEPLTDLTNSGAINFSNTDLIGGALQLPGMDYTASAMVAQSSGMPLKSVISGMNNLEDSEHIQNNFLPGIVSLGDVLQENGYKNQFIMGSDSRFGGRKSYLTSHGNYEIIDWNFALVSGMLPKDYAENWGFEDQKLFEFAQAYLNSYDFSVQPLNLNLLTSDTHFPDGYVYPNQTPVSEDMQYKNVIAYSSTMIAEFIAWCQTQPWYENTTIVLSGDHLTMDQKYSKSVPDTSTRTVFNLYINSSIQTDYAKNRLYSNLDTFPTTLASLGVEIEGNRLGLGTNLFSGEPTLIEQNSLKTVTDELEKRSVFYNNNILTAP
ncbi:MULTISPECIES: LTA synthase family protein [unclassified Enterococcus]|uniref:LTA synthase family protein n=1 Tax=unclassified Enterococcus TaxID=2608891 RepID=UPI0015524B3C|nr:MULTISPECIES: LTA synthase family protein [unclassified Enterococcus]MBS7577287.1 LTA synthase family protein [Enterococcus sp. MMGLQ5-2]MBS7584620.1 LTA synthase family protein [Enterococcus sp. MMGLQ5-1]NPD12475.1 LTA synthase family protein [Enterococcus sp. MMGLQ5-1]NPD37121.1 LTA synthase family protein [Enterococcus sp. MMGLQ5-2]